jgi:hypothetical protein
MTIECRQCRKTEEETHLSRCRVCFQHFCEEHTTVRGGVAFCSPGCATSFFSPDSDDDEGQA